MELKTQLNNLANKRTMLDSITISFRNGMDRIPKLVKTSVLLLEQMISRLGNRNIIVFPECQDTSLNFFVAKTLYDISVGKMTMEYDPHSFVEGEKLKIGNSVVEFVRCGFEEFEGESIERIRIRCADNTGSTVERSLPLDTAPFFQKTNTNRRLSDDRRVSRAIKEQRELNSDNDLIEALITHKTHMNSSIVYVSSFAKTREALIRATIENNPLSDYFLVSSLNHEGIASNIFPGQLAGTPAILLSSQVGYVAQALGDGVKIQSIILNIDEINMDNELDFLDEILSFNVPIICLTGTLNSFKTDVLKARGFNIWRWDKNTLTEQMVNDPNYLQSYKAKNCMKREVEFTNVDSEKINSVFKLVSKHKAIIDNGSRALAQAYAYLLRLSIKTIHNLTMPFTLEKEEIYRQLSACNSIISKEAIFISESTKDDLLLATQLLSELYLSQSHLFPKAFELKELLSNLSRKRVAVVISEDEDISRVQKYIETECLNNCNYSCKMIVMYPNEYINNRTMKIDQAIVVGWLGKSIMGKILYSFNAAYNHVLIYDCEKVWKNAHTKSWEKVLKEERSKGVEKELFKLEDRDTSTDADYIEIEDISSQDEYEQQEIEFILKASKYKSYEGSYGGKTVEAIPVSFVGGYLAFYTPNHSVVKVTNIIEENADEIEQVGVEKLRIGDFVAIRESARNLIRDVADQILGVSNLSGQRILASKWKKSLEARMIDSTFDDMYKRIKKAGCTKGTATVRNWINNEEMIIPRDKDDLRAIAIATGDNDLLSCLDEIYEAGNNVKRAHILAGRKLAQEMKQCIAEKLSSEEIEPFNIWGPVEIVIEKIGTIKLLKIIDINKEPINVSDHFVNRLLSEGKEVASWLE